MQRLSVSAVLATALFFGQSIGQATSPWPTEPDISPRCSRWIEALPGDDCRILAEIDGVPLANFLAWNPALARDCNAIKVGFGYCTENNAVISSTVTTSITSTSRAPTSATSSCPVVSCPVTHTVTTTVFVTVQPPTTTTSRTTTTTSRTTTPITTTTTTSRTTTPIITTTTSRTTTTTSRTTTSKATLATSHFPTTTTLKCVASASPIPNPGSIRTGSVLTNDIITACNQLVTTSSKFLEIGDPYTVTINTNDGTPATFLLAIKLGGFSVTNAFCRERLAPLVSTCSVTLSGVQKTYGGCTYTSDYNLMACIFPSN